MNDISDTQPPTPLAGVLEKYRCYQLPQSDAKPAKGAVRVTFLGTTMLMFDDGETKLMTDAFLTRLVPPPMGVESTIQTDSAAVDAALSRVNADHVAALFVAHSHCDHVLDVAFVARRTGAILHGSESTLNVARGNGLPEGQMALYEPGKELTFERFAITILKSRHSPPIPGVNDDLGLVINKPLRQPAKISDYMEGGSFDILIRPTGHAILVKSSANYVEEALDNVWANVLFLATATAGNQNPAFRDALYAQTVGKVRPKLVIPIHWDNFMLPLSDNLQPLSEKDTTVVFDLLIARLAADGIEFGIMQGYQSIMLFDR